MVLELPPIISVGILLAELAVGSLVVYKSQELSMLAVCIITGIIMLVFCMTVLLLFG